MHTTHRIIHGDARDLSALPDSSVHLVVTSPPYPLVGMWDDCFRAMSDASGRALDADDGDAAFQAMHGELDKVWAHCHRVLVDGGIAAINIGDATRTIAGRFSLWPNHARILSASRDLGLVSLPDILWRKPTNAPNKFMGSGMYPAGAYVTYEHEYILILRKGDKRAFSAVDKVRRRRSAYFWEERNVWFSDVWFGLPGVRQELDRSVRDRSGAYPIALPYRLICMYSLQGDTVLDPFGGTGSTALAAAMTGRDSVSVETDAALVDLARQRLHDAPRLGQAWAEDRLAAHRTFVADRLRAGKTLKHHNQAHGVAVITRQERDLELVVPKTAQAIDDGLRFDCGPPAPPAQAGLFEP
ncbi:MAG: site-specific DNA-methyltransferase [Oligoflexia bacterium]|nr:site-specific DNA-methyltransferase [Oligoflexia bacterium]